MARWIVDVEREYDRLRQHVAGPPRGVDDDFDEHGALFAMMHRWDEFNPADAQYRHMLIGRLQEVGYRLEEPVGRSSKANVRTYMRVLREDGVNAGIFNSSTFTFVRARNALPANGDLVNQTGRYPPSTSTPNPQWSSSLASLPSSAPCPDCLGTSPRRLICPLPHLLSVSTSLVAPPPTAEHTRWPCTTTEISFETCSLAISAPPDR